MVIRFINGQAKMPAPPGSARKIYQAEGYKLIKEEPHHSFGHGLVAETWELKL